jgi:hypothetical protein
MGGTIENTPLTLTHPGFSIAVRGTPDFLYSRSQGVGAPWPGGPSPRPLAREVTAGTSSRTRIVTAW